MEKYAQLMLLLFNSPALFALRNLFIALQLHVLFSRVCKSNYVTVTVTDEIFQERLSKDSGRASGEVCAVHAPQA